VATIQIRNIPDEVYLTYKRRALRARRSLQEYLLDKLTSDAAQPTLDEVLERAADNAVESVGTSDILDELARARSER
jgi:antitoxin FitA